MMFMDELSTTKKLEKATRLRNQEGGMNESGHTFILLVNVISKMLRSILKRSCERWVVSLVAKMKQRLMVGAIVA